jgi:hypothetical protein
MATVHGIPLSTLSNWGHEVEGFLALLMAIAGMLDLIHGAPERRMRYLAASLNVLAGLILGPVLLLHHGATVARAMLADPQQAQHVAMGFLLVIGGGARLIGEATGRSREGSLCLAACVGAIGVLFLFHAQHGTDHAVMVAMVIHRLLGLAFLTCAVSAAAFAWGRERRRAPGWVSQLSLLAIALLLIAYREPQGAFMGHLGTPAWVDAIRAADAATPPAP